MEPEHYRRNLAIFGAVMQGRSDRAVARSMGISHCRVDQVVRRELGRRGFDFEAYRDRRYLKHARELRQAGGLRRSKDQRRRGRANARRPWLPFCKRSGVED